MPRTILRETATDSPLDIEFIDHEMPGTPCGVLGISGDTHVIVLDPRLTPEGRAQAVQVLTEQIIGRESAPPQR